uniref:XK-related protein n=2 Tax=Lygus hesperus TaxID=30085 RepID=A0A0A9W0G2_LYGHE
MKNVGVVSSRLSRMEMGDGQATGADGDKASPDLQQIYKDEVDRLPNRCHVTNWDLFVLFMSIISHVVDVALDLNLAYRYYKNEDTYDYFILTILFIYFPAFVNTFISLRMYVLSDEMASSTHMVVKKWTVRIFILIFQLAPVMRYCDSLDYALKSRRAEQRMDRVEQIRYYELMLKEDSDVALLRVFECFLEAAPQQILQLSIVLMTNGGGLTPQGKTANTFTWLHQGGSIASSLLSMAWSMASYHRSVRFSQRDKANMPLLGTAAQFMWHFNVTVSRILSISAITSLYWAASVSCISIHWVVMTVWLALFEETQFVANSSWRAKVSEIMFCGILGLVYIFTYLTPSGGATRHRYLVYYPICFFENALAIIIWSIFSKQDVKDSWYFVPLIISGIVPFIVGIGFMAIYYKLLHPQTSSRRVHSADRERNDVMTSTVSINI